MAEQSNLPDGARPTTRQELYDLLRRDGLNRDSFVLQDMKRLGFWPDTKDQPSVPEQFLNRESQLYRELNALVTEKRRVEDREQLLKELRKQRMAESRRKREETKKRRIEAARLRAENWEKRKETEINYLGEGVSGGLNDTATDTERLALAQLPVLSDPAAIAAAMNIRVSELRFLAFSRAVSKTSHYRRFLIPKKTGGFRQISAPMYRLKDAQYWILQQILDKVPLHEAAHGFVPARSIVSNARPHVGAGVVINADLQNFFPSITYPRVKGVFRKLGYSDAAASTLGLLCTEPAIDEVVLDGENWFVAAGERFLPQGAPTSPAITNILCRQMDRRLQGLAQKLGFTYTRYADDLTFSASGEGEKKVNLLLKFVRQIIENEGFVLHPDKTRVMRTGRRKEVTGIVVNEKPGVDRKTLRRFRALLHQLETEGPAGKTWGHTPNLLAAIEGYANYVFMVDPEKGAALKAQVRQVAGALTRAPRKRYPARKKLAGSAPLPETPTAAPTEQESAKPWWKFW
ncbi:MAG: RNA-directed DNA polymerase [Saprospiraceae bacterium]|nr:RNA-directed DNA polymerase [Saprospiraceae bacterium]